jgi:hypothetical protein
LHHILEFDQRSATAFFYLALYTHHEESGARRSATQTGRMRWPLCSTLQDYSPLCSNTSATHGGPRNCSRHWSRRSYSVFPVRSRSSTDSGKWRKGRGLVREDDRSTGQTWLFSYLASRTRTLFVQALAGPRWRIG